MEQDYDARLREFGSTFDDLELGDEVCKLIVNAGERLAAICLDNEAVQQSMIGLHRGLGLPDFPADYGGKRTWQELWYQTPPSSLLDLPLVQRLTSLNAYAFFGLSPASDGGPCSLHDIGLLLNEVAASIAGDAPDRANTTGIDKTLLAAQGRLALDAGDGISPEQLAALVQLGQKSMRNALTPSSGSGLEVKGGKITAESALKWLSARGDFKTSIWNLPRSTQEATMTDLSGELLWVPFARDNTEFDPKTCLRSGKYTVGPKGSEKTFEDYRAALECLARMRPAACWRRPNTVGNWGIVTALGFRPRTADYLGVVSTEEALQ